MHLVGYILEYGNGCDCDCDNENNKNEFDTTFMLYSLNEFKRGTEAAFVTDTFSEHSNLIWQTTVNLNQMERFQGMANMKHSKPTAFFFTKPGSLKFCYAME